MPMLTGWIMKDPSSCVVYALNIRSTSRETPPNQSSIELVCPRGSGAGHGATGRGEDLSIFWNPPAYPVPPSKLCIAQLRQCHSHQLL